MGSEAAEHAEFSAIRYAQVWEDADVLLKALDIQNGDACLSIASAGDNALSMLVPGEGPSRVVAIDLNPAQLACLALRVSAFQNLEHHQLLELVGSQPCENRWGLYEKCRGDLAEEPKAFWDAHKNQIQAGIGSAGKFERYFATFRNRMLPWVHGSKRIQQLLQGGDLEQRRHFYNQTWNSFRWRCLFKFFFSKPVMGRLGRDKAFFRYVEGSVADRIMARTAHALTELNPAENPYLQWILTGHHTTALPHYLRPENFRTVRNRIDRIEWHQIALEDFLTASGPQSFNRYNLSDLFEYVSLENTHKILEALVHAGRPHGRLAYWNMLVPRSRPDAMADQLNPLTDLSQQLLLEDKAFFYQRLVVEEIIA